MQKTALYRFTGIIILAGMFSIVRAQSAAKIDLIEGKASILRNGASEWRDAKINQPLSIGDVVYTRNESFCVIKYNSGAVLRMGEETKIILQEVTDKGSKTATPIGHVWVNMQKLVTSKKSFELSSPTATAAIRGTIFDMNTGQDSSTDVSVFQGKVMVGPGSALKSALPQNTMEKESRHEVPGPEEIPGPYEVTLEQWRTIVDGQMISVRKDGKFSVQKFDEKKKAADDEFVQKNLVMDKELEKGK